jgi:SAM-dependent methyltransferase
MKCKSPHQKIAQAVSSDFSRSAKQTQELKIPLAYDEILRELYLGLLGRPADSSGLESYLGALRQGTRLAEIIGDIVASEEFRSRNNSGLNPSITLPDLTKLYPEKYISKGPDSAIFVVSSDNDFSFIESLIVKHRYYDSLGVWAPKIDLDKRVTAAIVTGLGARSCLELGCFTGSVLSLLAEQGVEVCGVEVSHLAFLLAHANIHEKILFGNLTALQFDIAYDVFLGMDILEHLNPLYLERYISRISQLIKPDGFVYINSPMFGTDDVFGTAFEAYLPEWQHAGDGDFWRYMHCDAKGWPMHGHLVWASPRWWENAFLKHRLVRDRNIEGILHRLLECFFDRVAPARRSLFVLRHSDFSPNVESVGRNLSAAILPVVAGEIE